MGNPCGRIILGGAIGWGALSAQIPEAPVPNPMEQVVIVGGGPAGYTAALYAARAGLNPLVLEGANREGQLPYTGEVENYPGYPDGVTGGRMMADFRRQAKRFGARFLAQDAEAIQAGGRHANHRVIAGGRPIEARAIILSMGARYRKLGVPGEEAQGDAARFQGQEAVVVGGGDAAMEKALVLAKSAPRVTIIHRSSRMRASRIMLDRAKAAPNIAWRVPYVVQAFQAGDPGQLARIVARNTDTGQVEVLPAASVFVTIGHDPRSELVRGLVDLDPRGYVLTQAPSSRTSVPGIFAAGDLVDPTYRQAITAASSGCIAAMDAERYLRNAGARSRL